ncbi:MAG: hypothetical protein WKF91_10880 [Segetibacter sp.]
MHIAAVASHLLAVTPRGARAVTRHPDLLRRHVLYKSVQQKDNYALA